MLKRTSRRSIPFAIPLLALGLLTAVPGESRADFDNFQILRQQSFEQTGANTVVAVNANFSADANLGPIGDYTSATLTPPGATTPLNMGLLNFPGVSHASLNQYFATPSEMEAAFPLGTYTFAASGPAGDVTATVEDSTDLYAGVPMLTEATFLNLPLLNPAREFTLDWKLFGPGSSSLVAISLALVDQTDSTNPFPWRATTAVGATSYVIPANIFQTGHQYRLDLSYQNIHKGTETRIDYSQETSVYFTISPTAVPEPASVVMLGLGALGLLGHGWQRRRKAVDVG